VAMQVQPKERGGEGEGLEEIQVIL
jgi:hypothetical protein